MVRDMIEGKQLKFLLLNHNAATSAWVTEKMKNHSWIHFACHAIQDKDLLKSEIHLYDCQLELLEMIKLQIPHVNHAFLSACQTSTGDETLSDEAVHIAVGMLAVRYWGIVTMMWSISDAHRPEIAKTFYEHIFNMPGEGVAKRWLVSGLLQSMAMSEFKIFKLCSKWEWFVTLKNASMQAEEAEGRTTVPQ